MLRHYETFEESAEDIKIYIHFYKEERLQAKLKGLSQVEIRTKAHDFILFLFFCLRGCGPNPRTDVHLQP
ncbi:IS3 family transposase [Caldibacillus debilis]|uniref:IS3 family transposase n=1 Tax=Caldibacillus debilis TaxID=301148 RepID=UPI000EA9D9E3